MDFILCYKKNILKITEIIKANLTNIFGFLSWQAKGKIIHKWYKFQRNTKQ